LRSVASTQEQTELAMARLEVLLLRSGVSGLRPVALRLADGSGTWSFDPKRRGRLFQPIEHPNPAAVVGLSPALLLRLITQVDAVSPEDSITIAGDVAAVAALASVLRSPLRWHSVQR